MQTGKYTKGICCALYLFGLSFVLSNAVPFAASQEVSASLTGSVSDPSGSMIAGANVTIVEQAKGLTYNSTTNESGTFFFPRIPAGSYRLRVENTGFKTVVREWIVLTVNQRARVDVALEVGSINESVEVTGDQPLLQTDTTMVGTTVSANRLENLPLLSRNYVSTLLLTPGVTAADPASFNNDRRTTGGGRPYVNGNRKEANNFLLDGIDNNQVSDNLTSYQPNPDAIAEVKMITNNASAEFGNFQGGVVNIVMKGGTNELHGSLFHFFKNDKLNANTWQNNWNRDVTTGEAVRREPVRYNSFGFTLGGPVFIPKFIDGRNKLFFFVDYMGLRRPYPATASTPTVMPTEFRNGDFSRLLNLENEANRASVQLYNPYSVLANGNRAPFVNNQIPRSMFSPAAVALLSDSTYYPGPLSNALRNNQSNRAISKLNLDQGDVRMDAKPNDNNDISVRYSHSNQDNTTNNTFPLTFGSFEQSPFKAGVVNWTSSFSPTLVNELRVGVNRITLHAGGTDKGIEDLNAKYGIAGVNSPGLLNIQFNNSFTSGIGNMNIGTAQLFANTTYHLADNFTVIRGNHMMKMGGQILRQHMNTFYAGNNGRTGFMQFNGRFTGQNSSQFGWGDADFLLGMPETLGRGLQSGTWGHRKWIYGVYFQDDWRVARNLTLNLGMRWEYHTPLVEVNDRQANFGLFSGELMLAGQNGNSRALYNAFKKDFQPRVGFAWTPFNSFVVRGAYTISSFMEGTGTNLRLPLNPPFNQEFEGRYDNPAFSLPGSTLSQGLGALVAADPFARVNIRLWDPNVRPANTQQWNFTIEKQLPGQSVWTVGYVGQKGHHLTVPMPFFQRQLNPDGTTTPSPYLSGNPQLANIAQISGTATNGNQQYHGLQTSFRKTFSGGLELLGNYTFSKGMSDAIGYYGEGGQAGSQSAYWQYLYNRRLEWGPTYFDARHMANISHVWDVPIGRGRKVGNGMNRFADAFIGNWQINGILTFRSGLPLTIRANDNSGSLSRGYRADRIGTGGKIGEVGQGGRWFDTSAYAVPRAGTLGSAGNGTERGPELKQYDVSLQKEFPLWEGGRLELRGEFLNVTNTPQFNGPNRTVNSVQFGEIVTAQNQRQGQIVLRLTF